MNRPLVSIEFKDYGLVKILLYPEHAKETVNNFVNLIQNGYYDNMAICRSVQNRLIQSGDPNTEPTTWTDDTPGYILNGEFNRNDYYNPLSFKRGTLGMAMAADKVTDFATAGSFFIMTKNEEALDRVVPAFGRVTVGMDVIDRINSINTHTKYGFDSPEEIVYIKKISVDTFGIKYDLPVKVDISVLK